MVTAVGTIGPARLGRWTEVGPAAHHTGLLGLWHRLQQLHFVGSAALWFAG
jgi:hypothetical protein